MILLIFVIELLN